MTTNIYIKHYDLPDLNLKEALAYALERDVNSESADIISELYEKHRSALSPTSVFSFFPLSVKDGIITLADRSVFAPRLAERLCDATYAAVFVATVGKEADRLIKKYELTSPAKALLFSALASERAERAADAVNAEISKLAALNGFSALSRFSPGYGDLPLDFQSAVFDLLEPSRRIGCSLSSGFLMTPTKSVSAIIGLVPNRK
jgi:cobalamin-dependent methionine synthase I